MTSRSRFAWLFALCLCLSALPACAADADADADAAAGDETEASTTLETDDEKTIYAMGLVLAQNMKGFGLSGDEVEILQQGIADALLEREAKVDLATYGPKIQGLVEGRMQATAAAEEIEGQEFLTESAAAEGAERLDSGIVLSTIEEGDGARPSATDTVQVHYHGMLRDGTVFDSSVERGEPATFPLGQVVPCWTEGLQQMQVGGKYRLVCPSELGYGAQPRPGIPPNSVLVFEVELLDIVGDEETPAPEE